jgi:hypothetical protein
VKQVHLIEQRATPMLDITFYAERDVGILPRSDFAGVFEFAHSIPIQTFAAIATRRGFERRTDSSKQGNWRSINSSSSAR